MKKEYIAPEIAIQNVDGDIITFSETTEWLGPVVNNNKKSSGYSMEE